MGHLDVDRFVGLMGHNYDFFICEFTRFTIAIVYYDYVITTPAG